MNKPDVERIRKILDTWRALSAQLEERGITRDILLEAQEPIQVPELVLIKALYFISWAIMSVYSPGLSSGRPAMSRDWL